ncbi:hypothetical protein RRG08_040774 [Elysia crispata]|uniref:Uncharacterized protein n=1 Tax=Elysia crispata TaxID=231223 RepID=A0AAE1BG97_9GAST|nr:hypothetical protein RRG08_040774 [Elysia crispata]
MEARPHPQTSSHHAAHKVCTVYDDLLTVRITLILVFYFSTKLVVRTAWCAELASVTLQCAAVSKIANFLKSVQPSQVQEGLSLSMTPGP